MLRPAHMKIMEQIKSWLIILTSLLFVANAVQGLGEVYEEAEYEYESAFGGEGEGENRIGRVLCGSIFMTLQVDKALVSKNVGFLLTATKNRVDTRSSAKCANSGTEGRILLYTLALNCADMEFQEADNTTIYRHDVHLGIVSKYYKEQLKDSLPVTLYTISLECTYVGDAPKQLIDSKLTLLEFRDESKYPCYTSSCSYGGFCISDNLIDGYKCQCSEKDKSCQEMTCPDGYYSCGVEDELGVCLPESKFCDASGDCPNKSDEMCSTIWSSWNEWSECDCARQVVTRKRKCQKQVEKLFLRTNYSCEDQVKEIACVNMDCLSITCASNNMFISLPRGGDMDKDYISNLKLNMEYIEDLDNECIPMLNETHMTFHLPLHLCGTTSWSDGEMIYYNNEITIPSTVDESAVIMRKVGHSFMGTCQYNRESTVHLKNIYVTSGETSANFEGSVEMAALMFDQANGETMNQYTSSGDGEFAFKLLLYPDNTFIHPYSSSDYPLMKRLGERIYAEVKIVTEDEDLNAVITKCWATSGDVDANMERKQYVFIEDGCANDPTTVMEARHSNQIKAFDRFSLEAFRFVGEKSPLLYFRCDVIVCDEEESQAECMNHCNTPLNVRSKRSLNGETKTIGHVQQGPVIVFDTFGTSGTLGSNTQLGFAPETASDGNKDTVWSFPLMAGIFASVSALCLIVGVGIGFIVRKSHSGTNV